jgi:hypothetical protein
VPIDASTAITPTELQEVLEQSFKANKSTGLSNMPLQVLKFMGSAGIDVLADFLNSSAIAQLAPESWRQTKVVPLYKGQGDKQDPNNYRSIAVVPPFAKLFMSCMNQRLTRLAEKEKLHAPTQAGFRKKHTTTEQALIV